MELNLDALDMHLAQSLSLLYVIVSDEHLLAIETADKIRKVARDNGFNEREVLVIENSFSWSELIAINSSQSLFGNKKLIELRISTNKLTKDGSQALQNYTVNLNPANLTIISLPKLHWSAQKSIWINVLRESSIYLEIAPVERTQLPIWISNRLALQQQNTDQQCLEFIADHVEGNLLAAQQEIQKLILLYPPGKLNFQQVRNAVLNVARYDVFKLNEAILSGDAARLVRMIYGLKGEGEVLPLVLWVIAEEIRTLLKLKFGMLQGKTLGMLLRKYRIWGTRERLLETALHRISLFVLQTALQEAAQIDRMIKGLYIKTFSSDVWDALAQLCLKLVRG